MTRTRLVQIVLVNPTRWVKGSNWNACPGCYRKRYALFETKTKFRDTLCTKCLQTSYHIKSSKANLTCPAPGDRHHVYNCTKAIPLILLRDPEEPPSLEIPEVARGNRIIF